MARPAIPITQVGPEERALPFTLSLFRVKRQTRIIWQFEELRSLTLAIKFRDLQTDVKCISDRPSDRSVLSIYRVFPMVKQKLYWSLIARISRRVIRMVRCSALWASHDTGTGSVRAYLVPPFWHILREGSRNGESMYV